MHTNSGSKLYQKAKKIIPGGTQLLSKRPEMFLPDLWPSYYSKCKGIKVWDLDGNVYFDFSTMGVGASILGYSDEDIDMAVKQAIDKGNMCTLNAPEEVELAELLCKLHPWANKVRYARGGGEAMAVAVRIARAKTRKDIILFCGYHGWHDWYLSANLADENALDGHLLTGLSPAGVPRALKKTSIPFNYNDKEGFLKLIHRYKNKVAAVVLEAVRNLEPDKEFVSTIRQVIQDKHIVFIVDEITSGWRLKIGGAHLVFGFEPDIAVFAKGMSNGFPMGAIIGKENIMDAAQESFISSTYWTDRIGPVAALATIKKMKEKNVPAHLINIGKQVQDGWKSLAEKFSLEVNISGIYPLSHFSFNYKQPLILKTLFTQLMLERNFLASTSFYASYAHTAEHLKRYLEAVEDIFSFIGKAIQEGNPGKYLKGPACDPGFKRLN